MVWYHDTAHDGENGSAQKRLVPITSETLRNDNIGAELTPASFLEKKAGAKALMDKFSEDTLLLRNKHCAHPEMLDAANEIRPILPPGVSAKELMTVTTRKRALRLARLLAIEYMFKEVDDDLKEHLYRDTPPKYRPANSKVSKKLHKRIEIFGRACGKFITAAFKTAKNLHVIEQAYEELLQAENEKTAYLGETKIAS